MRFFFLLHTYQRDSQLYYNNFYYLHNIGIPNFHLYLMSDETKMHEKDILFVRAWTLTIELGIYLLNRKFLFKQQFAEFLQILTGHSALINYYLIILKKDNMKFFRKSISLQWLRNPPLENPFRKPFHHDKESGSVSCPVVRVLPHPPFWQRQWIGKTRWFSRNKPQFSGGSQWGNW